MKRLARPLHWLFRIQQRTLFESRFMLQVLSRVRYFSALTKVRPDKQSRMSIEDERAAAAKLAEEIEELEVFGSASALRASIAAAMNNEDSATPSDKVSFDEEGLSDATIMVPAVEAGRDQRSMSIDTTIGKPDEPIFASPAETDTAAPMSAYPRDKGDDLLEESRDVVEYPTDCATSDAESSESENDEEPSKQQVEAKAPTVVDQAKVASPGLTAPTHIPSVLSGSSADRLKEGDDKKPRPSHQRHQSREGGRVLPVRQSSRRPFAPELSSDKGASTNVRPIEVMDPVSKAEYRNPRKDPARFDENRSFPPQLKQERTSKDHESAKLPKNASSHRSQRDASPRPTERLKTDYDALLSSRARLRVPSPRPTRRGPSPQRYNRRDKSPRGSSRWVAPRRDPSPRRTSRDHQLLPNASSRPLIYTGLPREHIPARSDHRDRTSRHIPARQQHAAPVRIERPREQRALAPPVRSTVSAAPKALPHPAHLVPGGKLSPSQLIVQIRDAIAADSTFYYTLKGIVAEHEERNIGRKQQPSVPFAQQYGPAQEQHVEHRRTAPSDRNVRHIRGHSTAWETFSSLGSTDSDSEAESFEQLRREAFDARRERSEMRRTHVKSVVAMQRPRRQTAPAGTVDLRPNFWQPPRYKGIGILTDSSADELLIKGEPHTTELCNVKANI